MNQKNIFYRTHLNRDRKSFVLFRNIAQLFSSISRLLLEVPIRKNFGERYFRLKQALGLVVILGLYPVLKVKLLNFIAMIKAGIDPILAALSGTMGRNQYGMTSQAGDNDGILFHAVFPDYTTWYIYLGIFLVFSVLHYMDQRRRPSVFDFTKYSRKSGDIHPLFFKIKIPGFTANVRNIECFFEPAFFFLLGLALWAVGQNLGTLFMFCSVIYCITYLDDYDAGDDFILDQIDKRILAEDLRRFFVEDHIDQDTSGRLKFTRSKLGDAEQNKEFYEDMIEQKEEAFEVG